MSTDKLSEKAIQGAIKSAVNTGKPRRISDGAGLYLDARPTGAGWWRLRYWQQGRESMLSLGTYPDVPLRAARERRNQARASLASGVDLGAERKAERFAQATSAEIRRLTEAGLPIPGTFEHVARQWHSRMTPAWSVAHAGKVLALLENDLFPYVGASKLTALTGPEILKHARRVEDRGATETAYRVLKAAGAVFRFGVQQGYCASDPTRDLKGAIVLPPSNHRAAITDPRKLGELLRAVCGYQGTPIVRAALALAPLLFLRPGELRKTEWAEVDLEGATLSIPSLRMKGRLKAKLTGKPHLVPLVPQAVAILRDLRPLTGNGKFVFPSALTPARPMSDNAVNAAFRRMGIGKEEVTGHGFRATVRTLAVEHLTVAAEVVEAQLAHAVGDALGRAYNRTQFLQQRRQFMSAWADYLDQLRDGSAMPAKPANRQMPRGLAG